MSEHLGPELRRIREGKGLTVEELAEKRKPHYTLSEKNMVSDEQLKKLFEDLGLSRRE